MNGDSPTQPDSPWKFTSAATPTPGAPEETNAAAMPEASGEAIEWTASEYIAHHKTFVWYAAFVVIAVLITAGMYFVTHDVVSTGIIAIIAVTFGVAAGRQPQVLPYRIDRRGVTVGKKLYTYSEFRSFFVTQEGPFSSITLTSTNRFAVDLTIYYAPEDEHEVIEALSNHLPLEQGKADLMDRLMHHVRF